MNINYPKRILWVSVCSFLLLISESSVKKEPWIYLFNEENLAGWTQLNGSASYTVEKGMGKWDPHR
jgi:hypothetical protein